MPSNQEIIDYYIDSKMDYRIYNLRTDDLAMHYGLWDATTRSHREALLNENRVLARRACISAADEVLDLGCGYGSTAVCLAERIGCRVTGITLNADQVESARLLARKHNVHHLVKFHCMDFHQTSFPDAHFDVVLAIESIAHSSDKPRVLREAFRLLKSSGRLVIADGYFRKSKTELTDRERKIAKSCCEGVHVPMLPDRDEFERWLKEAGFQYVKWSDKTSGILPTARRVHWLVRLFLPMSHLLRAVGLSALRPSHMRAFIDQYYAFRDGLGTYGIFLATKPDRQRDLRESLPSAVTKNRPLMVT